MAKKCSVCKKPLSSIILKKRNRSTGKISLDTVYYCKDCDRIPENKV